MRVLQGFALYIFVLYLLLPGDEPLQLHSCLQLVLIRRFGIFSCLIRSSSPSVRQRVCGLQIGSFASSLRLGLQETDLLQVWQLRAFIPEQPLRIASAMKRETALKLGLVSPDTANIVQRELSP